jgi:hypothetical protein
MNKKQGLHHNFIDCLERKVAKIRKKIICSTADSFVASDLLPHFRMPESCCCNCLYYEGGYEGKGNCMVLARLAEEYEDTEIFISGDTSIIDLCDFWEADK